MKEETHNDFKEFWPTKELKAIQEMGSSTTIY